MDVASGAMFNTWVDVSLAGAVPLAFARYYSTALLARGEAGPLGAGWRHCYEHELRQTLEGFAYTDHEGVEYALEDLGGAFAREGRLTSARDALELRGTLDDVTLEGYGPDARGLALRFARLRGTPRYRLVAVEARPGARLDLRYDAAGRLVEVTQARSGRALALRYDAEGRLAGVAFASPREDFARFEYDPRGRLARVLDRLGPRCTFQYDTAGRVVAEARRAGAVYAFRYDAAGRCVYSAGAERYEERSLRYVPAERATEVTDSHGGVTRYEYNAAGQVTLVRSPLGVAATYAYDDDGRPTASVEDGVAGALEYDALGRIAVARYPDGRALTFEYDARHRPVRVTDARGRAWTYELDDAGRLARSRNPEGHEWRYAYTAAGDVARVTNPVGATETYDWDAAGHLARVVSPDGLACWFEHDAYGRRVTLRDPAGGVEATEYDAAGNVAAVVAADGRRWEFGYDDAGRRVLERRPDGTELRRRYNACGLVVESVEADGATLRFEWDTEPGRILAVADGNGNRIAYTYDADGRPVARTNWDGARYAFEYDGGARLTALVDPTGARFGFEYDDWGRLAKRVAPDGTATQWEFDLDGFLARVAGPAGELRYERDLYGRVTAEVQGGTTVRSAYDPAGRRVTLGSDLGADVAMEWSPGGLCTALRQGDAVVRFGYDALGREVARALPSGGQFVQDYDPVGRITRQAYLPPAAHDAAAGGWTAGDAAARGFARRLSYDAVGHLTWVDDSLRGRAELVHDAVGRLRAVFRAGAWTEFYDNDLAGNRTATATVGAGVVGTVAAAFPPDARGVPALDVAGLRAAGAAVTESAVGPGNRVSQVRGPHELTRYEHDAAGRLVAKVVYRDLGTTPERWTYEWHAAGTLAAVVRPDGARWTYDYDPLGRRVAKHGPGGATRYVWDGPRLLHRVRDDAPPLTRVPHPTEPSPLLEVEGGAVRALLPDWLGSVSEVVGDDGRVAWTSRHGTWGEVAPSPGERVEGFPGQDYDEESGLYYNLHRYYDPALGRFLTQDPIGLLGGFNEYAYAPSPAEWIDPDGLALTGGPFAFQGGNDASGRPDLRGGGSRAATNPDTGNTNTVRPPRSGEDAGGKTIAVVRGSGVPASSTQGHAFISGHGNPNAMARPPATWNTSGHDYGNWCHAEIHAANWLRLNGQRGGTFQIYIDRPPCDECSDSLARAVRQLRRKPYNMTIEVHYLETDAKGTRRWQQFNC